MNSANVWHFYHISRKKKYGPFSFEQLCSIFSKNNIQENQILIFKNGWDKWRPPLSESIFHDYFYKTIQTSLASVEEDHAEKCLDREHAESPPTIAAELKVIIVLGKRTFKTQTLCIGENTLLFKHNLPSYFIQENLSIYLKSPDNHSSIKLSAKVLNTNDELVKFQIENEFSQKIFDRWLKYFTEKSENKIQTKKIA